MTGEDSKTAVLYAYSIVVSCPQCGELIGAPDGAGRRSHKAKPCVRTGKHCRLCWNPEVGNSNPSSRRKEKAVGEKCHYSHVLTHETGQPVYCPCGARCHAPSSASKRESVDAGAGPYRVETFNEDRAVIYLGDAQVFTVYGHTLAFRFKDALNAAFHAGRERQRREDAEIARNYKDHTTKYAGPGQVANELARAIEGGQRDA